MLCSTCHQYRCASYAQANKTLSYPRNSPVHARTGWGWLRAGLLALALLAPIIAQGATHRLSVSKISNGGWNDIKATRVHFSFPANFNRDRADAVVGFESEACFMQNVAANTFVSDAPGERRSHEELTPSTERLFGSNVAESRLSQYLLTSLVLGVPFGVNVFDAVIERCGISNAIYSLGLTREYGIAVFSKQSLTLGRLRFANAACSFGIKLIEVPEYQGSLYKDCSGGGAPQISQPIRCERYNAGTGWELLDLRDRQVVNQQPSPLSGFHLAQLPLHGLGLSLHSISLTPGLARQACQVANCAFEVGRVGGVPVSEVGHDERPYSNKARKPFIDREAIKKTSGAILAFLVVICGAVGFALIIGAVDGHGFGLMRGDRILCAVSSVALLGVAFFVLSQWAAPLLQGF